MGYSGSATNAGASTQSLTQGAHGHGHGGVGGGISGSATNAGASTQSLTQGAHGHGMVVLEVESQDQLQMLVLPLNH
jgi:hypothetical protein